MVYRIDNASAASALPTLLPVGTPGYFTDGNPVAAVPATIVDQDWANMVQEELVGTALAAGLTPTKGSNAQLLAAILMLASVSLIGGMTNAAMNVAAASASATFTADEAVLGTALGGQVKKLANFNQSINLATVGVGGMDVGTAPASGFVGLYAIYNPTTATRGLLGVNGTAAILPTVYGGAHMPAGYTLSTLIGVWPTTPGGLFAVGYQIGRHVNITEAQALYSTSATSTVTSLSISGIVPPNAKTINGTLELGGGSTGAVTLTVAPTASTVGRTIIEQGAANTVAAFFSCDIVTLQTIYYTFSTLATSPSAAIQISGYTV